MSVAELKLSIYESICNNSITEETGHEMLEILQEGANADLIQLYNNELSEVKKSLKDAKKLMRSDPKAAIDKFNDVKKRNANIKKYVSKCDDTTMEKIIGAFALIWRSYIFDIFKIGNTIVSFAGKKMISNFNILTGPRPIEPNVIHNQIFNWAKGEWELDKNGLKKMEQYNSELAKYEVKVAASKSLKVGKILYGVSICASIAELIKILLDFTKAIEGSKKLLEKDMDKEHWDRMVTKTYNPLRSYIYQVCDEIDKLVDRYIDKAKIMDDVVKEYVDDLNLRIYDAHLAGEITEAQRDELLNSLYEE